MTIIKYPHIEIRDDGVPHIEGTETKVVEVVLDRLAHHWDADEIQRQRPQLSLAQIYSALAYYHDHETEIEQDIQRRLRIEGEILATLGNTPLRKKLQRIKAERLSR